MSWGPVSGGAEKSVSIFWGLGQLEWQQGEQTGGNNGLTQSTVSGAGGEGAD